MIPRKPYRGRLPGLLSVALSMLLAVQVILSFMPQPASAAGGMQVVICGAGGLRTVAFDPVTGEELPQQGVSAKCPFCVVGIAVLSGRITPLPVSFQHYRADFALSQDDPAQDRHWTTSRIRGPPLAV